MHTHLCLQIPSQNAPVSTATESERVVVEQSQGGDLLLMLLQVGDQLASSQLPQTNFTLCRGKKLNVNEKIALKLAKQERINWTKHISTTLAQNTTHSFPSQSKPHNTRKMLTKQITTTKLTCGPPVRMNLWLWERTSADTPPWCALSRNHRFSPVSAEWASTLRTEKTKVKTESACMSKQA